jgi:hypothetical protein
MPRCAAHAKASEPASRSSVREQNVSATAPLPPPVETWRAGYLRLAAFPEQPVYGIAQNWWQELTGSEASECNEKRQTREKTESGDFAGANLLLEIDLVRVQWTAQVVYNPLEIDSAVPTLGPFVDRSNWFRELMKVWLGKAPPLKRLAFAGRVEQPVAGHVEGYELLNRYLRSVDVDTKSSDFLYRVNRRRSSRTGIPDLEINRLCTWAVRKQTLRVNVSSAMEPPQVTQSEFYATVAEFDINTVPELPGGLLPSGEGLIAILHELVDLATEIATVGDQP